MKMLLILTMVIAAGSAHAFEGVTCKGIPERKTSESVIMTLSAVDQTTDEVGEEVEVPYKLLLKEGNSVLAAGVVQASVSDVLFGYEGKFKKYGKVTGMIYLDELYESWINVNGKDYRVDCAYNEAVSAGFFVSSKEVKTSADGIALVKALQVANEEDMESDVCYSGNLYNAIEAAEKNGELSISLIDIYGESENPPIELEVTDKNGQSASTITPSCH